MTELNCTTCVWASSETCKVCKEKKESQEECVVCGALIHLSNAYYLQKAADDEFGPFCRSCYESEGE